MHKIVLILRGCIMDITGGAVRVERAPKLSKAKLVRARDAFINHFKKGVPEPRHEEIAGNAKAWESKAIQTFKEVRRFGDNEGVEYVKEEMMRGFDTLAQETDLEVRQCGGSLRRIALIANEALDGGLIAWAGLRAAAATTAVISGASTGTEAFYLNFVDPYALAVPAILILGKATLGALPKMGWGGVEAPKIPMPEFNVGKIMTKATELEMWHVLKITGAGGFFGSLSAFVVNILASAGKGAAETGEMALQRLGEVSEGAAGLVNSIVSFGIEPVPAFFAIGAAIAYGLVRGRKIIKATEAALGNELAKGEEYGRVLESILQMGIETEADRVQRLMVELKDGLEIRGVGKVKRNMLSLAALDPEGVTQAEMERQFGKAPEILEEINWLETEGLLKKEDAEAGGSPKLTTTEALHELLDRLDPDSPPPTNGDGNGSHGL